MKPLKVKGYGSIPHLPNSRMGPGDHHCDEGQGKIATREMRDAKDRCIVTLKLDGSNVAVANIPEVGIAAINRAGHFAESSPWIQHRQFAAWVGSVRHWFEPLKPGHRMVGEWLSLAHGTRYQWPEDIPPFVVFDVFTADNRRLSWDEVKHVSRLCGVTYPIVLHDSMCVPLSVEAAMKAVNRRLCFEQDAPEGAVWRIERNGEFDFMAKYVRPDKVDGKYLQGVTGCDPVWNWRLDGFDHEEGR